MDRNKIKDKLKTAKPASWDMIDKSVLITENNLNTYRVKEVFIVAIEKLSELQQELSKIISFGIYNDIDVQEEIADVMLSLNMIMISPINREKFKHMKSVDISFDGSDCTSHKLAVIIGTLAELQQYLSKFIRGRDERLNIYKVIYDIYDYLFVLVDMLNLSKEDIEKIISIKIERQIDRYSKKKE